MRILLFVFSILSILIPLTLFAIDIQPTQDCIVDSEWDIQSMLQGCAGEHGIAPGDIGTDARGFKEYVVMIANGVLWFAALFAVGALVYAGIIYTTSYGEDEKIKNAKSTAQYALIGLVLALLAFPMVSIVVDFLYSL